MPKVKVPRKSTAIDMTAMCDVASLLLTFFILTATARQPEPLTVDTPTSTVKIKVPETNIGTLTVGEGKVFFGVKGQEIRMNMLDKMGERYGIKFTEDEKKRFSLMESFGIDIRQLKQVIALSGADRNKPGLQTGIPADSVGQRPSQLHDWIYTARLATKEVANEQMRVSIKGDAKESYPVVKKIIDVLQKQKVNKFSLITSLEGAD